MHGGHMMRRSDKLDLSQSGHGINYVMNCLCELCRPPYLIVILGRGVQATTTCVGLGVMDTLIDFFKCKTLQTNLQRLIQTNTLAINIVWNTIAHEDDSSTIDRPIMVANHNHDSSSHVSYSQAVDTIVTPLNVNMLKLLLDGYPRRDYDMIISGFTHGFHVNYVGLTNTIIALNHQSALCNAAACNEIIQSELKLGRLVGPYTVNTVPFVNYRISPIGLVKKNEPGKFRLIHDLSSPLGISVNDAIPWEYRTVTYENFDKAVAYITAYRQGVTLSKIDIEGAFRIVPIFPGDRHILGLQWEGNLYFDKVLPFGLFGI
jgi:hypothetical protein